MRGFTRVSVGAAALALAMATAAPAEAKQVCGWYAIALCTSDRTSAVDFVNEGWGAIIDTDDYTGLRGGLFCVVSGPQSRSSAIRDRNAARANGVSADTYIKRACTDESNVGD